MNPLCAIIRAANEELIVRGRADAVGEFFATDYVVHLTGGEAPAHGHAVVRGHLAMIRRAFGEPRVEVEILMEGADRVAWQRSFTATQSGPYKGFPASQREVAWRDMVVSRFQDGLIAEEWVVTDLAERLLLARKR